jgi:hypothetical protein
MVPNSTGREMTNSPAAMPLRMDESLMGLDLGFEF